MQLYTYTVYYGTYLCVGEVQSVAYAKVAVANNNSPPEIPSINEPINKKYIPNVSKYLPTNNIFNVFKIVPIVDINKISLRPFLSDNDPSGPIVNIAKYAEK